jgi:hypothetical protein
MIDDEDNLLLSGMTNSICISAKEIPIVGKTAEGNIMCKSRLKSVTKI